MPKISRKQFAAIHPLDSFPAIKHALNANYFPNDDEQNNGVSMTQPDMHMSIREIMDRYARGLDISNLQRAPGYKEEDDDTPDPRFMDMAEREEYSALAKDQLKVIKQRQKERHEHRQKQQQQKSGDVQQQPQTQTGDSPSDANKPGKQSKNNQEEK